MKLNFAKPSLLALALGLTLFSSCDNIEIVTPPGPAGVSGQSAYEVWVSAVKAGTIAWKGTTELADYLNYLKGSEGESAYESWKKLAEKGNLPDPKISGAMWPKDRVALQDFFDYLTGEHGADGVDGTSGANGKSAYELWKEEVVKGTVTDRQGTVWPKEDIDMSNFLSYLKGENAPVKIVKLVWPTAPIEKIEFPTSPKEGMLVTIKTDDSEHFEYKLGILDMDDFDDTKVMPVDGQPTVFFTDFKPDLNKRDLKFDLYTRVKGKGNWKKVLSLRKFSNMVYSYTRHHHWNEDYYPGRELPNQ